MRQFARGVLMVAWFCLAAGTAHAEAAQDARLLEAQAAFDEVGTLWKAGRYSEALAKGEQALALQETALGASHPDVARSLVLLGARYLDQGNSVRAEPFLRRALAIQEAALGQHHPEIAQTLIHLANLNPAEASLDLAEPLYARALAIRQAAFGDHHLLVAESLNHLANNYRLRYWPTRAEPLLLRALAIQEAALGEHHLEVARTSENLAYAYLDQGLSARAEPLFVRALAIREATLGKDHPGAAFALAGLAWVYEMRGLPAQAELLFARVQALQEAALANNPPNRAAVLIQLAGLHLRQGTLPRAESLYERALAEQETTLGKSHPLVADTLYGLAVTYALQGLYGRAEPLYERALAIREADLGPHHPAVADPVVGLGNLYLAQGLYVRAEPFLERALAIRQAALGDKHKAVARALASLGSLHLAQGSYTRAEPLLKRALAIFEASPNPGGPEAGKFLSKLGKLYMAQGLHRRAQPLFKRALAVTEAAYGPNDPDLADALHELAGLYSAQGLYGRAQPLYERVLAIRSAALGENTPRDMETLNHLAVVHLGQRRLAEALPLLTRAFALSEQRLRQDALGFSEAHLASFLQLLRTDEDRLYALLRAHPDNPGVQRLALSAALLRKGRSAEEMAGISRTIHRSLSEHDRDTFERLRGLRAQLSQLSLQGHGSMPLAEYQQRLQELAARADALEAALAKRSAPMRALTAMPPPAEIAGRVAAALPKDSALIEFITYVDRPLAPRTGTPEARSGGHLRYLALVLLPDATVRTVDLGPAEPLDSAAWRLRDALANRDAAFQPHAQALYQLAFQPLLPLLGETRRLFLSVDGQLALVPFAALHDGHQLLVETFHFTYLTSGKELLPRPQEQPPSASVVVLADPDFSAPRQGSTLPSGGASPPLERSASVERFLSASRADLSQRALALAPLPGTRREALAIQRLLPQAQLFLGPEATKQRLLHLPAPGLLHLATHGFFLQDAPSLPGSRALGKFGALGEAPEGSRPPDPLLRSGLFMAGSSALAGSASSEASPGHTLVTALELASLNLWGTQLVVLSACDTGRGDVKLGQGVYGLRRALVVAGAETVVMSLWKVDDETTRALMEAYYRNLLAGQGRATALTEAMRWLRATHPDPHSWAPFIVLGRDSPLRAVAQAAGATGQVPNPQSAREPAAGLP
jgi:CHAT domain-containing protein/Tfp pilus assembly protein PilF